MAARGINTRLPASSRWIQGFKNAFGLVSTRDYRHGKPAAASRFAVSAPMAATCAWSRSATVFPCHFQALKERLDTVDAGKNNPVVGFDLLQRSIESGKTRRRLDFDGRKFDHFAAQSFDALRQATGLFARPGHDDASPG